MKRRGFIQWCVGGLSALTPTAASSGTFGLGFILDRCVSKKGNRLVFRNHRLLRLIPDSVVQNHIRTKFSRQIVGDPSIADGFSETQIVQTGEAKFRGHPRLRNGFYQDREKIKFEQKVCRLKADSNVLNHPLRGMRREKKRRQLDCVVENVGQKIKPVRGESIEERSERIRNIVKSIMKSEKKRLNEVIKIY